jgi:hypothetical protein
MKTIIANTPPWVLLLFIALLYRGYLQTKPHQVSARRLVTVPTVLVGFSFYSAYSAFGLNHIAAMAWGAGFLSSLLWIYRRSSAEAARFDAALQTYAVPGSWLPFVLMMAMFFTKYAVTVSLIREPALHDSAIFILLTSLVFGALSGAFAGRALRALRASNKIE